MIRRPPRSTLLTHSFPTRRSSDLTGQHEPFHREQQRLLRAGTAAQQQLRRQFHRRCGEDRSEEHTSELQSLMRISYAVFCLKKKTTITQQKPTRYIIPTSIYTQHIHLTHQNTTTDNLTVTD